MSHCYTHSLTTTVCLMLNNSYRDRRTCGCDAVKLEPFKQLRKRININNDFFRATCNNSGSQSAGHVEAL